MRVFVIAGEASGDRLGAALMAGLHSLTEVEFTGVGGPLTHEEGLTSIFPMDDLSVHGIAEVARRYPLLRRRLHQTVKAVLAARPDVLITIDSPDFCLRVARLVRAKSAVRTVHYVAPSVWAWRPGRAAKMAGFIDHVLALLPFEPPYMQAAGMECDFVGHPVVSEPQASKDEIAAFRALHGIGDAPLLMVLPGSRRSEVAQLAPIFGDALQTVCAARPDLRLVVPATAAREDQMRAAIADWPGQPVLIVPGGRDTVSYLAEKTAAFGAADRALAASGTVSLELAASDTPMLIAYDVSRLSRLIFERMLKVDTLTLVNLVTDTRVVPELLGAECRPDRIATELLALIDDPGEQHDAMRLTMERLGAGGEAPGLRAARAVLARLG
ncbi:lipid-A-disaccharide synthase [Roseovarius amoyensis]|uniref:lipid-A-disaccharide synthase n=1 Tax=Roseovarius amoyensis TaxID=2211448 RepID=UPI001955112F|nr:lipid-A-disaccharide synthase [Roseovarius amoyensis]